MRMTGNCENDRGLCVWQGPTRMTGAYEYDRGLWQEPMCDDRGLWVWHRPMTGTHEWWQGPMSMTQAYDRNPWVMTGAYEYDTGLWQEPMSDDRGLWVWHRPMTGTHEWWQGPIGRFSEAGLHEWMPFVIFHARSCERLQRHFWASFWIGIVSCCV